MDESVGGFAGLKAGASFIELLLGLELFWRSRLPFHASHHAGGLLESGLGGSGIDGAAQFGLGAPYGTLSVNPGSQFLMAPHSDPKRFWDDLNGYL